MRQDSAEFCAACHKVHLDQPVNHYRWFRGFNEYDNWQASGVSGQGARSFYYPDKSSTCADCHMPQVPSHDPGNRDGMIHSHRFPAANTMSGQTIAIERHGKFSNGVHHRGPVCRRPRRRNESLVKCAGPPAIFALASTFAVGEEAEQSDRCRFARWSRAALDAPGVRFQPAPLRRMRSPHAQLATFPAGTVMATTCGSNSSRGCAWPSTRLSGSVQDNAAVRGHVRTSPIVPDRR
jgi:hypothetical protein